MGSRYAIPWRWLLYRTTFENGANPDIKNNYGVSPKSLARTIANYDVRRFFNNDNKQQTD